ncbi:MAG: hypothetical protein JKP97_07955 [Rhodobacteraceae bacterium]|nr:hypothetical protein [Paracoccaceae bacterium]
MSVSEILNSAANAVTAIAVAVGVAIAYRQLSLWRVETKEKQRASVAEDLLFAAMEAHAALRFVRSPFGSAAPENDPDPKSYPRREKIERLRDHHGAFEDLQRAQIRGRAFLGNSAVDEAVSALLDVRHRVWLAADRWCDLYGESRDLNRELYNDIERTVYGSYTDEDPLGKKQIAAIETLEKELYPMLRLERT